MLQTPRRSPGSPLGARLPAPSLRCSWRLGWQGHTHHQCSTVCFTEGLGGGVVHWNLGRSASRQALQRMNAPPPKERCVLLEHSSCGRAWPERSLPPPTTPGSTLYPPWLFAGNGGRAGSRNGRWQAGGGGCDCVRLPRQRKPSYSLLLLAHLSIWGGSELRREGGCRLLSFTVAGAPRPTRPRGPVLKCKVQVTPACDLLAGLAGSCALCMLSRTMRSDPC